MCHPDYTMCYFRSPFRFHWREMVNFNGLGNTAKFYRCPGNNSIYHGRCDFIQAHFRHRAGRHIIKTKEGEMAVSANSL